MAAQELQGGREAMAGVRAALGEDLARQMETLEEREGELVARHPGKFIAVCGGDVFVGDTDGEAVSRARAAHPGRPFFLRMHYPEPGEGQGPDGPEDGAGAAVDEAFEADIARQRDFFEAHEGELLARHPRMSIAVCADEAFAGSDDDALSKAEAAHPDRAVYLCSYDPLYPCQCDEGAGAHGRGGQGGNGARADPAFEADIARQQELLEARIGGLLERHAGKSIAMCAGEVFVADDDEGALSRAEAAHPDRAVYLRSHNPFFVAR